MKPAGRIAAAIEVLADIEGRRRPVAEALKDWGLAHRFAGAGDRAAIGNIVYDALRWRLSSAWIMGADSPRALALAVVGRRWALGAGGLDAAFADDIHAPAPLTADERARLDAARLDEAPDHVRADVPEWLAERFAAAFGAGWVAEGAALALRPPLDMRVNTLKADRDKVLKTLARLGAAPTPFSPEGLRIPPTIAEARHPNVQVEPGFRKGWFEIQDEGSQLAALLAGAAPGAQVLDLAAGAGGKTLALSAAMAGKGQIHATDGDRARLAPIFERLKRAGTRNVQVHPAGTALADLEAKMDIVLVDAPCTGTGVWRRRPDAKWRLTEKALAERVAEQTALLESATRYVRPGGRLAYVTCSLLPEENDDRIAGFLSGEERFSLLPPHSLWQAATGASPPDGTFVPVAGSGAIRLTPARHNTDGFFIAVLERRP